VNDENICLLVNENETKVVVQENERGIDDLMNKNEKNKKLFYIF